MQIDLENTTDKKMNGQFKYLNKNPIFYFKKAIAFQDIFSVYFYMYV